MVVNMCIERAILCAIKLQKDYWNDANFVCKNKTKDDIKPFKYSIYVNKYENCMSTLPIWM